MNIIRIDGWTHTLAKTGLIGLHGDQATDCNRTNELLAFIRILKAIDKDWTVQTRDFRSIVLPLFYPGL